MIDSTLYDTIFVQHDIKYKKKLVTVNKKIVQLYLLFVHFEIEVLLNLKKITINNCTNLFLIKMQ